MPRELEHFEQLTRWLEAERAFEREQFALDRASLPLQELVAKGRVLLDVVAKEQSVGLGGRSLLTLELENGHRLPLRLSPGEMVSLAPRKAPVESPPVAIVARCTAKTLQLAFERPPPDFLFDGRLRIDLLANDATFDRARQAVSTIAAMDKGRARKKRDVILGQVPPSFDAPAKFEAKGALNPEQQIAVSRALSANDFFLIHGPPGTGKSHVLAEVAVQLQRRGQKILATAASNAAVDHLLELCLDAGLTAVRVGHPARVLPHLQSHTLDELVEQDESRKIAKDLFDEAFELFGYARRQRSQGRSRTRFSNARDAHAEAKKLLDDARALERKAVNSVLSRAQVVCSTLASLEGTVLRDETFDVALLDEATQATEPLSLLAFVKAERVLLAGDPKQLSPTVMSRAAEGLRVSLFERLSNEHKDIAQQMLKEQHRFPDALMEFPSRESYGSELRSHPDVKGARLAHWAPLLFIDTAGKGFDETSREGSSSLCNEGEATLISEHVARLQLPPNEVGIITPYRAQAELLRELLPDELLEIDTVDGFQGREKTAILVSLVRSNREGTLGFLEDLRRMNVAITRAKRHLFIVGDSATLGSNTYFARLIEHAQTTGAYRSAWEWPDS